MNIYLWILILCILLINSNSQSADLLSKSSKVATAKVARQEKSQHNLHFEFCSS